MCYSGIFEREMEKYIDLFGAEEAEQVWELFDLRKKRDPKTFKDEPRTYPKYYAPVAHLNASGHSVVSPMRYSAYPPPFVDSARHYTSYNARRDNLTSPFWSEAFGVHHGFVIMKTFFESVKVGDLIGAGVVSLEDAQAVFARSKAKREEKIIATGKKYKATATELKPPLERSIEIAFTPVQPGLLLVPIIYSYSTLDDGRADAGFAIVTDPATTEIQAAGHDRRPIILDAKNIEEWIHCSGKSFRTLDEILGRGPPILFQHRLSKVD